MRNQKKRGSRSDFRVAFSGARQNLRTIPNIAIATKTTAKNASVLVNARAPFSRFAQI